MKKVILLSVILAAIVIPARMARHKDGKEGLKKTLIGMAVAEVVYLILITQVWFRM